MGHLNYDCALIDIRADRKLKESMVIDIPNLEGNGDVLHMVRVEFGGKNGASTPKESTSNLFDALKMVENDDDLGENGGISKTVDNEVNPKVTTWFLGTNREKAVSNIGKNKESVLAYMERDSDMDEVYN
ncbi:hypothetical protein Tco_1397454, partial [Tanacetum coccineum]